MENEAFLTDRQLAKTLQCSVPAIRLWNRQGMPCRRFGRLVRYRLEDVLRWFDERQQRNGQRLTVGDEADRHVAG